MSRTVDVSIIIVSFNTKDLLRDCIKSVQTQTHGLSFEIIVVDNDSQDGSAQMVQEEFPELKLVASTENNGFAKGNNLALPLVEGKTIFYLNPDTILLNNAVKILFDHLQENPDVGIVGPRLFRNLERVHHPSIRTFTTPNDIIFRFMPGYRLYEKFHEAFFIKREQQQSPDWLMGAALLGHTPLLKELGGFDEAFFVYSEEEDLCRRMKIEHKKDVLYCPDAHVAHLWGGSSRQAPHKANEFFWDSQMIYLNRYFSPEVIKKFVKRFTLLLRTKARLSSGDQRAYFEQTIELVEKHCP